MFHTKCAEGEEWKVHSAGQSIAAAITAAKQEPRPEAGVLGIQWRRTHMAATNSGTIEAA